MHSMKADLYSPALTVHARLPVNFEQASIAVGRVGTISVGFSRLRSLRSVCFSIFNFLTAMAAAGTEVLS
jgi:hypothetical protein